MKIALAQLNYHIGNFKSNNQKIIENIEKAKQQGAELIVFAELAICGYPPLDLLEKKDFRADISESLQRICKSSKGIGVVIGATLSENGKLYNTAYFLNDGKMESHQNKMTLHKNMIFNEQKHFHTGEDPKILTFEEKRFLVAVGEDLFSNNFAQAVKTEKADFLLNLTATPFAFDSEKTKKEKVRELARKYQTPLLQINQVGANGEFIFAGNSKVLDQNGEEKVTLNYFKEDFQIFDTEDFSKEKTTEEISEIEKIHDGLVLGIKDYFAKNNFKKAVVGLSGGIDSAVTLVLAQRALGRENLHGILMPSAFSSEHSVKDAVDLAENLNISYDIVPIKNTYDAVIKTMEPVFQNLPFNVAEENIQARLRGLILMAYSNKFGHLVLNTSNKSEMAVGYGTLYGDMAGALSILGDVYKTKVFELAIFMNKDSELVPVHTIVKPPSAELRPNQKDSDSLPDYEILDRILYHYIEENLCGEEIIEKGYEKEIVAQIIKMTNRNEYKRYQAAPLLRLTSRPFGIGRNLPLVCQY